MFKGHNNKTGKLFFNLNHKVSLILFLTFLFLNIFPQIINARQLWEDRESSGNSSIIMRILLGRIKGDLKVSAPGGIDILNEETGEKYQFESSDTCIIKREGNTIKLPDSLFSGELPSEVSLLISSGRKGEPIKINGKRYRGKLRIQTKKGYIQLINIVPLEEYLYGVVPKEFKTTYPELAKAQAVVARTYALGHKGKFEKDGYDFYSGVQFQLYGGFDAEDRLCNEAVDATKNQVIVYNCKLAKYPLYHSTCGGKTADNESVFLTDPIPYLRSVQCDDNVEESYAYDTPKKKWYKDSSTGNNAGNDQQDEEVIVIGEEFEQKIPGKVRLSVSKPGNCQQSRYYRWKVEWTKDELSKLVNKAFPKSDTGKLEDIKIEKRGLSGRVVTLVFKTDKGEFKVEGNKIRFVLRFKRKNGSYSPLYSTRFNLKKKEKNGKTTWTAEGSGWGHGVGMCQFGALGLAKKGAGYKQILKKYFKGIKIRDYHELKK